MGEEEYVIVSGSTLEDGGAKGYFLRERVGLLVILAEEMIIVS